MERFEAPVRDKHGKIINAEDAEARQAAREKRNVRRAEGAAKARAKHAPTQAEQKSPAKQVPEQKPAAVPAEREEEIPYYSLDLLPPRTEQQLESNTPFDSKDILTRKYKRPARRVVPSLSQVSLLPGSELKETFSARLRTDDESVLPSRTGDATDRLLARKKSAGKSEKSSGRKKPAPKGKRKPEEKKSGPEKPSVPSPQTGQSHSGKKKNGKQPQAETAGKAAGGKRGARRTATRKSGGQGRAVKRPANPDSRTHQKDSTEQASLMKPYYLSDLKKR